MVELIPPRLSEFFDVTQGGSDTCTDTVGTTDVAALRPGDPRPPKPPMAENSYGMRPQNKSRSRNKPGNNGNHNNSNQRRNSMGNIINRVFESAGPDGKVRGTPQQIIDKYQALARDAQVSGDRVAAESYLQHSEHYSRLLGEAQRQQQENRFNQPEREDGGQRDDGGFDNQRRQPVMAGPLRADDDRSGRFRRSAGPIETPEGRRAGPVETPEGRRAAAEAPAPALTAAAAQPDTFNGSAHPAAEPDEPARRPGQEPAPAKRSRPRRRPKADAQPAEQDERRGRGPGVLGAGSAFATRRRSG